MRIASLIPIVNIDGSFGLMPVFTYFAPHKLQGTPARRCRFRGAARLFKGWRA